MKRQAYKIKYVLTVLLAVFTLFTATLLNVGTGARATVAANDVVYLYENQNVWTDLQNSTIGDEEFDISKFPHKDNGDPKIISFVEFCYSYFAVKQVDYGLYVYVYNPQDKPIDANTERNKIQFTYGNEQHSIKPQLKFLNYSTEPGYEGRFYKFKVQLSDAERISILKALEENKRVYKVSGIELSFKNEVTEYACAQTYTYSGYAKGYGSELAANDTLQCVVDGLDEYLTLDVHATYFRPEGTHSDGYTKDTLHSVYFSVPNEIVDKYGEMTAVKATWLNAYTAPILVTGNQTIYTELLKYLTQYVNGGSIRELNPNTDLKYSVVATKAVKDLIDNPDSAKFGGYYAYNHYTSYDGTDYLMDVQFQYDNPVYYLNYLFYAENGDADNYTLPAEKIIGNKAKGEKGWLEAFTEKYGNLSQPERSGEHPTTELVNNRYARVLFDEVDEKFTVAEIESTKEYKLTDQTVSDTLWDRLFGTGVKHENSYTMSAIQKVTADDITMASSVKGFCDTYYIDESDYDVFRAFVKSAESKAETTYLFRYHQAEYVSNEATEYERIKDWALIGGDFGNYKAVDTNAYFAQEWIQLDFDIIDLTFTKNDVKTVIPVVMSPIDIAADVTPPPNAKPDEKNWWGLFLDALCRGEWWAVTITVIVGLIVLAVLIKLLSLFFPLFATIWRGIKKGLKWALSGLWWLIKQPFIAIKKLAVKLKARATERKERKKKLRQAKLARKEALQISRYQNKLLRKEQIYREKIEAKDNKKAAKQKAKQDVKAARQQAKAEKKTAAQNAKAKKQAEQKRRKAAAKRKKAKAKAKPAQKRKAPQNGKQKTNNAKAGKTK